jgi:hypothetical protein
VSAEPVSDAPFSGVLDTNVLLDIFSCRDLTNEYDQVDFSVDSPASVWRRARTRESLLAAMYLHKVRATTFSLQNEALDKLTAIVPPEEECFEMHYTTLFIWYVRDYLLSGWNAQAAAPVAGSGWHTILSPELLAKVPELLMPGHAELAKPTSNRADAWHIAYAKQHSLPLITNEGFKATGYAPGKIAKRARAQGVTVLFPKDVYAGKVDERAEAEAFLARFRKRAPEYLETHPSALNALQWMSGLFSHVLFGETVGRTTPVRVGVPG